MKDTKKIGIVFLSTVLIYIGASILAQETNLLAGAGIVESVLFSQGIIILPSIVYLLLNRNNIKIKEALRINPIRVGTVLWVILFAYCIQPLLTVINAISLLFSENEVSGVMATMSDEIPWFAAVFLIAFIPCVLEESVYRGIFYNTYRKVNVKRGILVSGLLFGLMHMNMNQFCYAFVMGCIFAVIVEVTDSIISTMIIHFIMNANSTILMYLVKLIPEDLGGASVATTEQSKQIVDEAMQQIGDKTLLLGVIAVWGFIAIIPTFLSIILLKQMAVNQGRLAVLHQFLPKKKRMQLYNEEQEQLVYDHFFFGQKPNGKEKIGSIPLVIGMAVCIGWILWSLLCN